MSIVKIQRPKKQNSRSHKVITVADKFFTLGALAGFFGMAGYGAHIWMMLTGQMTVPANYQSLKALHVHIQLYLFLSPFILGFLFQAGGKLLGADANPPRETLWLIPLLLLGTILRLSFPSLWWSGALVSCCYLICFAHTAKLAFRSPPGSRRIASIWILFGLAVFSAAPLLDVSLMTNAVLFINFGIVPIVMVAMEHFAYSFLKAERLQVRQWLVLSALHFISLALLVSALLLYWNFAWRGFALCGLCTWIYFIRSLAVLKALRSWIRSPLGFAFGCAGIWALLGAGILLRYGIDGLSFATHAWSIGVLTTLILAVSSQIMGFLSGGPLLSPQWMLSLLATWQLVPLGRSLSHFILLPLSFSWVVICAASIVLTVWAFEVMKAEWRIVRR